MNYKSILIILSISLAISYNYIREIDKPNIDKRITLHQKILNKEAESPYRYRILVPLFVEQIIKLTSKILSYKTSFLVSYALFDFIALFFLFYILFVFLKQWFSVDCSLIGILFVGSTVILALKDHYYQPWSLLEPGIYTLSLICIYRNKYLIVAFLVALSTFIRETAIIIILTFLFSKINFKSPFINKNDLILGSIYMLIYIFIYVSLRLIMGNVEHIHTLHDLFLFNIEFRNLIKSIVHLSLFMGIFWIYALLGYKKAPDFLKRIAWIFPLYLLILLPFSIWYEVRLLMPMYPIIISSSLSYLCNEKTN